MLVGESAGTFARDAGLDTAPEAWFRTEERRLAFEAGDDSRGGTVGAVARDAQGRVAAATSTGGSAGKHPARVGDSPLIAAGTWADDATAAISCTGDGEAIIRIALAHEIDALMRHAGLPLAEACDRALAGLAVARHGRADRGRRRRRARGAVHDARDAARLAGRERSDRHRRRARWLTSTTCTRSRSRSSRRRATPPRARSARPATARRPRSSPSSPSRRPAAWTANQVAREQPELIEAMLDAGAALREAQEAAVSGAAAGAACARRRWPSAPRSTP